MLINTGMKQAYVDPGDIMGAANAWKPQEATFESRIGVSVERLHKLIGQVEEVADTLHGSSPATLATGLSGAQVSLTAAGPPSVTKRIMDLVDAVDALERSISRVRGGL